MCACGSADTPMLAHRSRLALQRNSSHCPSSHGAENQVSASIHTLMYQRMKSGNCGTTVVDAHLGKGRIKNCSYLLRGVFQPRQNARCVSVVLLVGPPSTKKPPIFERTAPQAESYRYVLTLCDSLFAKLLTHIGTNERGEVPRATSPRVALGIPVAHRPGSAS